MSNPAVAEQTYAGEGAPQPNGSAFPDIKALAVELADVAVSFTRLLYGGEPPAARLHLAERLHELRELFDDPRAELGVLTDHYALWHWERVAVPDADPATYRLWRSPRGEAEGVFIECLTLSAGEATKASRRWRTGHYLYGTMTYTSPSLGDLYADKALARHVGLTAGAVTP